MKQLKTLLAAAMAVSLSGLAGGGASAEPIEIRAVTAWAENDPVSSGFFIWKERIEAELGDRVKITYLGAYDVVPANQQVEAVRNRVVDMTYTTPAYYATQVPYAIAMTFTDQPIDVLRSNGAIDFMQAHHETVGGVHILGTYWLYGSAIFLTEKRVESSKDFAGLKLRTGSFIPFLNALGASPVAIPLAETYPSLERGVIDGMTFPETLTDASLRSLLKYKVEPLFYNVNQSFLINTDVWNGLPKDLQDDIERISLEVEDDIVAAARKMVEEINEVAREEGMETLTVSDPEHYLDLAYSSVWEFSRARFGEDSARIEEMMRKK